MVGFGRIAVGLLGRGCTSFHLSAGLELGYLQAETRVDGLPKTDVSVAVNTNALSMDLLQFKKTYGFDRDDPSALEGREVVCRGSNFLTHRVGPDGISLWWLNDIDEEEGGDGLWYEIDPENQKELYDDHKFWTMEIAPKFAKVIRMFSSTQYNGEKKSALFAAIRLTQNLNKRWYREGYNFDHFCVYSPRDIYKILTNPKSCVRDDVRLSYDSWVNKKLCVREWWYSPLFFPSGCCIGLRDLKIENLNLLALGPENFIFEFVDETSIINCLPIYFICEQYLNGETDRKLSHHIVDRVISRIKDEGSEFDREIFDEYVRFRSRFPSPL